MTMLTERESAIVEVIRKNAAVTGEEDTRGPADLRREQRRLIAIIDRLAGGEVISMGGCIGALRRALRPLADIPLLQDSDCNAKDMIDAPDLAITPHHVRQARAALTAALPALQRGVPGSVYVASRASLPERSAMWRSYRDLGYRITSSWIDEAGEGETADFGELWERIGREIAQAQALVLYAEPNDFPLKGALIETGMVLGMGRRVFVCLPGVKLEGRTHRPIGSWLQHPNVTRIDSIADAMRQAAIIADERGGQS